DLRELKAMLTEMQRAEIAEESSKAKSDFLARMSHEIRTPMNAIMGITEIQLQDNSLPIVTKEALERIYNSGNLLVCIINDILDLSKIEAGKLEIAAAKYDITSLIYDTVKLNIIRFQSHPIDFKLVVSENIPVQLLGDELRIKQILNNLLSNAFKYTQKGYVELSVCAEPRDNLCVDMVFKVSDTGQGMTQEQVRHLGEKFGRFNISANRNTEGTGLGMNITNNLVDMMDGSIHVESAPNKGSVFTVRLPQRFDSSLQIGKDLADNLMKLNLKSTTKIRNSYIKRHYMPYGSVLAVDDVETNLYVVKGILSPYGLNLDTVLSGEEAIQKIKDGKVYDIIFMDHMMPKMDGIEAVKIIRELGYTKPIVALTANALFGQSKIFLDNGFDDYLFKPIDVRELNLILNKLIRDKQSAETLEAARKQKNKRSASGGASDGGSIVVQPKLAEVFVRDAEKAVDVLVASSKNNYRRADDIANLLINAHAMKSVLANVGEHELSKDAAMLEQAAREQKIDIMMEALPDFIEALQNVIVKFKPNVESSGDNDAEIITGSKEFLKQNLLVIQRACEYLNKKMIRECLTALREKTWEFAVKEQFKQLDAYILHSEFDEAGAFAKKMIDELDKEA
ncbi:MAG: ATP-binding protein, partial [Treponema sp.]|nr:ATP-binding protein [Treponema sp.]